MYDFRVISVQKVVDGDTVDLRIDVGFRTVLTQRIRLAIVDTPERGKPGFKEATAFTADWLGRAWADSAEVRLRTYQEDSFARWVGDIYLSGSGETVSSALLAAGLAEVWS